MSGFNKGTGDWTQYRRLQPKPMEIDFHYGRSDGSVPYWEAMEAIYDEALEALKLAHANSCGWLMFRHGNSTSHNGKTTARSKVRELMRSKEATPYISRRDCIQHESVFVAAIKARVPIEGD
jgi:hypothetical protein